MNERIIYVIGGAGFVGSHLCKKLHELGHTVYSIDNYSSGSERNHHEGVTYLRGNSSSLGHHIAFTAFPDLVYHLGEYSRVEQSFDDIETVIQYNQTHTQAVFECIRKNPSIKIVYAGSSTKYAERESGYVVSPYEWTKSANTELLKNYAKWFDLNYAITYFYNVYGPGEVTEGKYATLIGIYKNAMLNKQPLKIVLPGDQKRNFTHIDDIVDGLVRVGERGYGDEYGIGSDISITIKQVAQMFLGVDELYNAGSKSYELVPRRKGNRMSATVITDKTRDLGWAPKHRLWDYIQNLRKQGWKE